jgi:hypothetical protein
MCYERRRAEACVDESAHHARDQSSSAHRGLPPKGEARASLPAPKLPIWLEAAEPKLPSGLEAADSPELPSCAWAHAEAPASKFAAAAAWRRGGLGLAATGLGPRLGSWASLSLWSTTFMCSRGETDSRAGGASSSSRGSAGVSQQALRPASKTRAACQFLGQFLGYCCSL